MGCTGMFGVTGVTGLPGVTGVPGKTGLSGVTGCTGVKCCVCEKNHANKYITIDLDSNVDLSQVQVKELYGVCKSVLSIAYIVQQGCESAPLILF